MKMGFKSETVDEQVHPGLIEANPVVPGVNAECLVDGEKGIGDDFLMHDADEPARGEVFFLVVKPEDRITSYNVCYTKLLRLLEIHPDEVDRFLLPLPVNRIWGVGPRGAERLEQSGVKTIKELRSLTRERLTKMFGVLGERLYFLARGKDDRKVESAGTIIV